MKKLISIIALCISGGILLAQVPTYKWVTGSTDVNVPSNIIRTGPGPRQSASSWTDELDNLWLFGGLGYDKNEERGSLNDLWKYDVANNKWNWIDGKDIISQANLESNNSLMFDGIDDYIILEENFDVGSQDNIVDYDESFSWELWFKTASHGTLISLATTPEFEEGNPGVVFDGMTLNFQTDNRLWFEAGDWTGGAFQYIGTEPLDLMDDQWHHVAIVVEMDWKSVV